MTATENTTVATETNTTNEGGTTVATEKVNKSKLVVAAFKANGLNTPAKDLIDFIQKESGVAVTVSLVNNIRFRLKQAKADRKAKREAGKTATRKYTRKEKPVVVLPPLETAAPVVSEFDQLLAVRDFAATVGGLDNLKGLVAKLEKLNVAA